MRKIGFITALVVAMTAVSCVKEMQTETPAPEVNGAVTFEASFGAATKAVLELGATESKVAWEVGDQVGVFAGEGNFLYKAQNAGYSTKLLTEESGVPSEGPYYAVYPYDDDAVLAEGIITTTLPAVQTAVLGSFTTHLSVAQADANNKFAFKNVCGLVGVKIDAENVTKIVLEGNNGEIVAGAINVTVADAPTWTAVAEQGSTTVTLAPAEGTLAKGVYYFAVLPQTFEKGFNVKAYKGDDAYVLRNVSAEYELKRSDIVGSKAFGIEGEGTEASPYILKTPQDMVDMRSLAKLGGETWFKMANDIDLAGINWIPLNWDENYERKIHFDGGDFTLSNLTCDKAASGANYASLFGVLYGSCKNLKIDKATITSTNGCGVIGGYVGTSKKPGHVENVTITNSSVTNAGQPTGGVAGVAREGSFKNVSFHGEIVSTNDKSTSSDSGFTAVSANVGGFAGQTTGTASFENCSTDVTISSKDSDFAGFVGQVQGTVTFTDCSTKAIVNSSQEQKLRCAAFVGYSNGVATYTRCKVLEGSSINDVTGLTNNRLLLAGGFMGYAGGTSVTAVDCTVDVNVDLPYGQTVGGFVGNVGAGTFKATGCSVSGNVKGNNQVAGFVAYQEKAASLEISTSYSTATVTGGGHYTAGFAGYLVNASDKPVKLTDCYATGDVVSTGGASCSAFIGSVEFDLTLLRCYATGSVDKVKSNVGGLLGYAKSGTVSIEGCYFTGSLISTSGPTAGIIGYCGANATIKNTYVTEGSIKGGAGQIAGLVGRIEKGKLTITNSYVEIPITASGNPSAGLVGLIDSQLELTDCYYKGTLNGNAYVGGAVGQINSGSTYCNISRVYTEGDFTASGNYSGCLVGAAMGSGQRIIDCWSSANLTGKGQQVGGIAGTATASITVDNCFSAGDIVTNTSGCAGIIGRVGASSTITDCIAWNKNITCKRTSNGVYAPGAILGCAQVAGTYSNCWRRYDMVLTDPYIKLSDQNDFVNAMPPLPSYSTATHQQAYHGKAAAADATISSVAQSIGWSSEIWDFSGAVPTLK